MQDHELYDMDDSILSSRDYVSSRLVSSSKQMLEEREMVDVYANMVLFSEIF